MSEWLRSQTDPPAGAQAASSPSDDDILDDIVASCVESGSEQLAERVESACGAHPRLASAIRRRIESLREVGLLRDTPLASDDRFPERLGEFRLLERLGGGGMGVVFRARQESLGRDVALKLIRPEHLYFPRARERFQRETEAVARLQHPGIVPIYAVGSQSGVPYFAMELLPACTLAAALDVLRNAAPERLSGIDLRAALHRAVPAWAPDSSSAETNVFDGSYVNAVVRIVVQVADALAHAHARDVLHRDVKPSNIAVTLEGRALLFDFGLASFSTEARITATNTEVGSLHYMPPEQMRGGADRLGPPADVYSLGVTMYEALALQLPFAERELLETRRAILEGRCDPLRARNRAVPRELEIVCAKAMDPEPGRRYEDVAAFARDLRNVLERRPIEARPSSAALHVRRWIQRHPVVSVVMLAAAVVPSLLYASKAAHAKELGAALDESKAVNAFLVDLFDGADPTSTQGREVTAADLLDLGAKRLETELLDHPLARASLLNSIGESFSSLGEWTRAEEALTRALAIREQAGGRDTPEVAESLRELAALERQLGRESAFEHSARALELYRKFAQGRPDYELVDALVTHAMLLVDRGQLDQARDMFREALTLQAQLPGDRRDTRATVLTHLGNVARKQERFDEALAAAAEAIAVFRSLDYDVHPGITSNLGTIGGALMRQGKLDEARGVFEEALELELRLTGEGLRYAAFMVSLGEVEMRAKDRATAIPILERAVAMLDEHVPPVNSVALNARSMLALAYSLSARWNEALGALRTLGAAYEQSGGAAAPRTLLNTLQIAQCQEALGDLGEAEGTVASALELASNAAVEADDVPEAIACAHMARFCAARGERDAAVTWLARARELRCDAVLEGASSQWVRFAAGVVAASAGDAERARAEFEPLAEPFRGALNAETVPTMARGRLALAQAVLEPSLAGPRVEGTLPELERELGPDHPETRALVQWLETHR